MYIDKMDDYRKSLKKLAQDRKFDELNRRLKSTSMLEDEQDELYKNFDAIFLNLYPSFVEDFNALLTEDEARGAKKVLSAAALTYVAALASTLAQLLRLIIISRGNRRN